MPENEVMTGTGASPQGAVPPHMEQPYPLPAQWQDNRPMNYVRKSCKLCPFLENILSAIIS